MMVITAVLHLMRLKHVVWILLCCLAGGCRLLMMVMMVVVLVVVVGSGQGGTRVRVVKPGCAPLLGHHSARRLLDAAQVQTWRRVKKKA